MPDEAPLSSNRQPLLLYHFAGPRMEALSLKCVLNLASGKSMNQLNKAMRLAIEAVSVMSEYPQGGGWDCCCQDYRELDAQLFICVAHCDLHATSLIFVIACVCIRCCIHRATVPTRWLPQKKADSLYCLLYLSHNAWNGNVLDFQLICKTCMTVYLCGALRLVRNCVLIYQTLYTQSNSTHKMATAGKRLMASIVFYAYPIMHLVLEYFGS